MVVPIDADVAQRLWSLAQRQVVSFDELANRLIRQALDVRNDESTDAVAEFPETWYERQVLDGINVEEPGLYEWRVDGVPVYVGFYAKKTTAINAYTRNINNLLQGRPYRPGKPDAFRHIHYLLRDAYVERHKITLCFLENADSSELAARRDFLQRARIRGQA